MIGLRGRHVDKYGLDVAKGRVCSFAVLFPDTSRAGPAREQTLVLSRTHAHQLITF